MNAFTEPRKVQPGCQHQLGCKCEVPYHLRPSTPEERRIEERYQRREPARIAVEGDL